MKIELLKEEKESAEAKYREYLSASKTSKDAAYRDLKTVYNHVRKGKPVIDIRIALSGGGVRDNWHPRLAIAPAIHKKIRCSYSRTGDVTFQTPWKNTGWRWKDHFKFKSLLPVRPNSTPWVMDLEAPVPVIPPIHHPGKILLSHYILWEVDSWTPAPSRDPYLLRRLTPTLFLILAEWDLTDIEMAVMAGRVK